MIEINENFPVKGDLVLKLYDSETGRLKSTKEVNNLVVQLGKNFIARRLIGTESTLITHCAVGSGNAATNLGFTALQTESARVLLKSSVVTANVVTFVSVFPSGSGTGSIGEVGLFNDPTGGILLARTTFTPFTKLPLDILTVQWNIRIG